MARGALLVVFASAVFLPKHSFPVFVPPKSSETFPLDDVVAPAPYEALFLPFENGLCKHGFEHYRNDRQGFTESKKHYPEMARHFGGYEAMGALRDLLYETTFAHGVRVWIVPKREYDRGFENRAREHIDAMFTAWGETAFAPKELFDDYDHNGRSKADYDKRSMRDNGDVLFANWDTAVEFWWSRSPYKGGPSENPPKNKAKCDQWFSTPGDKTDGGRTVFRHGSGVVDKNIPIPSLDQKQKRLGSSLSSVQCHTKAHPIAADRTVAQLETPLYVVYRKSLLWSFGVGVKIVEI